MTECVCVCGCGQAAVDRHHVIYQQELCRLIKAMRPRPASGAERVAREITLTADPRNIVFMCRECHMAHHARSKPLSLDVLPDSVYSFTAEVLGAEAAYEYLRRRYDGEDVRLDGLLGAVA